MNYIKNVYSSKTVFREIGFCEHSHFLEASKKQNLHCLIKREK